MFTVIYSFKVKQGQSDNFIEAWKDMTNLIIKYEGGLGSRLHKQSEFNFIAYAQWPNKETWKNSGSQLPEISKSIRLKMRNSCDNVQTLFELDVVEDLLIN
mgnify:CR=1 FL=1